MKNTKCDLMKYDDCLILGFDNLNLHHINEYLTPASLGRISFNVRPRCTGLINALLRLVRSSHNCTLPLAFKARTKLLHHSDILSTTIVTISCCFCSQTRPSLSGSWYSYAAFWGGVWYGQLPSFTCNLNVSSKHPIPEKIITEFILNYFH